MKLLDLNRGKMLRILHAQADDLGGIGVRAALLADQLNAAGELRRQEVFAVAVLLEVTNLRLDVGAAKERGLDECLLAVPDPITFTSPLLPEGAHFFITARENGVVTGTLEWTTDYDQAGTYTVPFEASDGKLIASTQAFVRVHDSPPRSPTIAAEPPYHRGTFNTIWFYARPPDVVACYLEWATDPSFANVTGNSGWVDVPPWNRTARDLQDGQKHYYRVKARNGGGLEGSWSKVVSSTQDASPPQTAVGSLLPCQTSATFQIDWSGTDTVSGLASVQLFYRRGEAGSFAQYGGDFTISPVVFDSTLTGGDGIYSFYTVGTDEVGNLESPPSKPDAKTNVVAEGPPAPILASEPVYHPGTVNTIWFGVPGGCAVECYIEWAPDPLFANVSGNSGWVAVPPWNWTARDLQDGQTYYYRAKARNAAGVEGPWSDVVSSTQDALSPESRVLPLPPTHGLTSFTIYCEASDTVSSVSEVRLFYRHGGTGNYSEWPTAFTANVVVFDPLQTGGDGLYEFYSIAEDLAANREGIPAEPDTRTEVGETRASRWMLYR